MRAMVTDVEAVAATGERARTLRLAAAYDDDLFAR